MSADVLLDEHAQEAAATLINTHLRPAGIELRQTGNDGGIPCSPWCRHGGTAPGDRRTSSSPLAPNQTSAFDRP
ncbi:hypothetical protein ABZ656_18710 [Streptomyces sp. NPDC007095]|uniref:hypothetical protein n=1 Tax=Streptomyces sp. NPDC007095 TaxID=3154482 RepID=UPI0033F7E694